MLTNGLAHLRTCTLAAALALGLAGCQSALMRPANGPATVSTPHAYPIALRGEPGLISLIETSWKNHPVLHPVEAQTPAVLLLDIEEIRPSLNSTTGRPPLLGVLRQNTYPSTYSLTYRLSDIDGTLLAEDVVVGAGDIRTQHLPSHTYVDIPLDAQLDAADQLAQFVSRNVVQQPWEALVIAQQDTQHAVANFGKQSKLPVETRLYFDNPPRPAILRLVSYEQTPGGQTRAILRLESGLMPPVGARLHLLRQD